MKRILYASGSVLTGDAIAHAVVRYATILARAGSADLITIPVLQAGDRGTVEMLIGPSSQLMVEDAGPGPMETLDEESFLAELEARRDTLEHPRPVGLGPRPGAAPDYGEDL